MIKKTLIFAASAAIYIAFAIYLYQPYFTIFHQSQFLIVINVCLAAMGCFALSRRWVSSPIGSFFSGLLYGFGPFMLGLTKFHSSSGLLVALIPWLFIPAAYGPHGKFRWLRILLSFIPFLAVAGFFFLTSRLGFYPIPVSCPLLPNDLMSLLLPLVAAKQELTLIGFYHVPLAGLIMGCSMMIAARRFGVIAVLAVGTVLAFCPALYGISPLIWIAFPTLCCAVAIGAGLQGLVCAASSDKKWLLVTTAVLAVIAVAALLLATKCYEIFFGVGTQYARILVTSSKLYLLGASAAAVIYLSACMKWRLHFLRLGLLSAIMALDIFFSAKFIVDAVLSF